MFTKTAILGRPDSLGLLGFLLLAPLAGCGSGLVGVTGEVKLNGAPLPAALVQFHPVDGEGKLDVKRKMAMAQTDAAGKFSLETPNESSSGIFPGKYKVTVEASSRPNLTEAQKAFPGASLKVPVKSLVAPEYTVMTKTPLEVTIPAAAPIVLEVKGPAK